MAPSQVAVMPQEAVKDKDTTKTYSLPQEEGTIQQALPTEHGSVLILTSKNILKDFDPAKGTFTTLTLPTKGIQTFNSLALYNKKLYVLDATTGQVWKLVPTSGGFKEATAWLTIPSANIVLKGATLLTLDGSMFTSTPQGAVKQFDAGKLTPFPASIDPAPTNAVRLWTSQASKYIYLLDTASRRLVVLEKTTGKMVVQYSSPTWKGMRDFSVNEKTKTISLLTGQGIVEFGATHLTK